MFDLFRLHFFDCVVHHLLSMLEFHFNFENGQCAEWQCAKLMNSCDVQHSHNVWYRSDVLRNDHGRFEQFAHESINDTCSDSHVSTIPFTPLAFT